MKALESAIHKIHLTNILLDIYKDDVLSPVLGFKGGTAALFFYHLPRFSVDLNFDLITPYQKDSLQIQKIIDRITNMVSQKYTILDQSKKYNTLFWLASYGTGLSHIKIEVSTRDVSDNHYNFIPFYGATICVMDIGDMIAHKLVAVMDRKHPANRDLFDIHYFLSSPVATETNYAIITAKTGKSPKEFYKTLLNFVRNVNPNQILSGLGELLSESQKKRIKIKLLIELQGLIQRQIDML